MKKGLLALSCVALSAFLISCQDGSSLSESQSSSPEESSASASSASTSSTADSSSSGTIEGNVIYAAPNLQVGTSPDGSKENPYTFENGLKNLKQGGTLYLLEGTYAYGQAIVISEDTYDLYPATSEEERKTIEPAVKDDGSLAEVLFDFSSMIYNSSNRGLSFNTDYWHLKNVEVQGAGDNGIYIGGNHNIIEGIDVHHCSDTGIQLGRADGTYNSIDLWPSYNTILNCTSHDNADPTGEDSDGFACKLTTGVGNVFDGCIAYNNVDDGWDLYTKGSSGEIGPVTLKNCIAFNNGITSYGVGTANSDGNGFKLGGESISVAHQVYNCLAFNNLATGFTDNSNPGTIRIENCTSFNNGTRDTGANNFDMARNVATSSNYYKNLLSYCSGYRTSPIDGTTAISNSKDEYCGTASYSIFYYGLAMWRFEGIQNCKYTDSSLKGTMFTESQNRSPFVSTTTLQPQASSGVEASEHVDVHSLFRAEDGSIALGDIFKVNPESDFYTMGENGTPLGCDLSGE